MKNSNTSLPRQQISNRLKVILHDEDIRISIDNLFSEIKGFNFLDLKYLADWLRKNNKQTLQNFDSTKFQLQMKNDFVKDCLQRLLTLTVDWVKRAKQQGEISKRIKFVNRALAKRSINLHNNPEPFQDFPNHLLESKMTGSNGDIVKILRNMDYSVQFQKDFLERVNVSLEGIIQNLVLLFKEGGQSATIGGNVQFMIGKAFEVGNMQMKDLIATTFRLEAHLDISKFTALSEKDILKDLIDQSRLPENSDSIVFSRTKPGQMGCDYFFMLKKTNGPLIIIFMECGISKTKVGVKKLLAQIDI